MGFVKHSAIPRFIDERKIVTELRQLAKGRLEALDSCRMFVASRQDVINEFQALNDLALEVAGRRPVDALATAKALLEPEALELVESKCVNAYWLWYLLDKVQPAAFPLDLAALARAHARAKDSLHDNRHGFAFINSNCLEHDLKLLPPGFVLELWHKGRIVAVRTDSGEYPVRLNPLLIED